MASKRKIQEEKMSKILAESAKMVRIEPETETIGVGDFTVLEKLDEGISVLGIRKTKDKITCNNCKLVVSRSEIERHLYSHAGSHLPFFSCGYCNFVGAYTKNHHSSRHSGKPALITDNRIKFASKLAKTWNDCFGDFFLIENIPEENINRQKMSESSLPQFSSYPVVEKKTSIAGPLLKNQLMPGRSWTEDIQSAISGLRGQDLKPVMYCHLCNGDIRKGDNRKIFSHVLTHVKKPVYFCRMCPYEGNHILPHLRTNHRGQEHSFGDKLDDFEAEIIGIAHACFGTKSDFELGGTPLNIVDNNLDPSMFEPTTVEDVLRAAQTEGEREENQERESIFPLMSDLKANLSGKDSTCCNMCGVILTWVESSRAGDCMEAVLHKHVLEELDKRGPRVSSLMLEATDSWMVACQSLEEIKIDMMKKCFSR